MIKLIGILIIVIGFILKLDTIAVVLVAGIVTGLVGGLGFTEILSTLGEAFINTRYMTIFLLTLPVIGILERNGLRERAAYLIKKLNSMTAGKVLMIYVFIREVAAALSLRLGGHVQFIRPLILPMAQGAAENKYGQLSEAQLEQLKGYSASAENYGNFYGQNVFIASGGVLLVVGTLDELGITVTPLAVSKAAIPVAIIAFLVAVVQYYLLDKKLTRLQTVQNQNTSTNITNRNEVE
ncbi:DUF969 domain-containing protein [Senegalia massiliensis]|uniref:DUF969 domain-containing protein n=1 Tax=Senegalia massiliensis TaxID=1720316 RepID=A0A845R0Q0_9CLOT|nr:DUF969 domain-containing protein [Senegalia massiliensis]NBI08151.1 DUF969 domain-containing protein [Senegalia massiliensis]